MDIDTIVAELDAEIARLEQVRAVLAGSAPSAAAAPAPAKTAKKRGGHRKMSPEARARIAAAQKARWAKAKQGAGKPARKAT